MCVKYLILKVMNISWNSSVSGCMKFTYAMAAGLSGSSRSWMDGGKSKMPIRVVIGGQGKAYKLTDLVPRMSGRFPVFNDEKHIKNREQYHPKRRRRI